MLYIAKSMLKPKYIYTIHIYIQIQIHRELHIPVMLGVDKLQLSKCVARYLSYHINKTHTLTYIRRQIILTNCERYYYTKSTYMHTYVHLHIHIKHTHIIIY